MNKQQRIQAAIDALPNATGGEWRQEPWTVVDDETGSSVLTGPAGVHRDRKIIVDVNERLPEHTANATLIAAAKDLAEEVVRLRELLRNGGRITRVVGADMPGPGCRDHGVRTVAHKEGDVPVVDSAEVIPNTSGPDVSCDVCGAVGFPHGANCPRCGRPSNLLSAASEGEA